MKENKSINKKAGYLNAGSELGNFLGIFYTLAIVLYVMSFFLSEFFLYKTIADLENITRRSVLRMELEGMLTKEEVSDLYEELLGMGLKEIEISGNVDGNVKNVRYGEISPAGSAGEKVYLEIKGICSIQGIFKREKDFCVRKEGIACR